MSDARETLERQVEACPEPECSQCAAIRAVLEELDQTQQSNNALGEIIREGGGQVPTKLLAENERLRAALDTIGGGHTNRFPRRWSRP